MIFIDMTELRVPTKWQRKATKLTQEMVNMGESDRAEFIERNSSFWKALKRELERISYRKCWYCETRYTRADFHVDHHRPKNRIENEDVTRGPGYWWLAFDYRNFRLACSYCNCLHTGKDGIVRGKSDRFPLLPESTRASSPGSHIDDESPILLDPAKVVDPPLLWFLDDGRASPRYPESSGHPCMRAKGTIDILNLNDEKIVEARRELWGRCLSLIERGNRVFAQWLRGSSPSGRKEFEMTVGEIHQLTESSAEFSAAARACFRGSAYEWVREIVLSLPDS